MTKNSFISLKDGFKSVQKKSHYIASALFPIILTSKNDLNLVFFNYWTNKNRIKINNLKLSTRIYDESGSMICHEEHFISKFHNQISIKKILKKNKIQFKNIKGLVNVELISLEKLNFPFPAITGIYKSGKMYSAVHSAGRLKNNSEQQNIFYTEETNWSCKFDKNITPFFHYFVGNVLPKRNYIIVNLFNKNNKLKKSKKIFINNFTPFSSKIFLIKDIFNLSKFENNDFISVDVEHNSIFPRMIVGNFYSKLNFYEVTHSFPRVKSKDYCPINEKNEFQSKIVGYRNKDLNLDLKIFPTTCEGNFKGETFIKKFNDNKIKSLNNKINFSEENLKKMIIIPFTDNEEVKSIKFKGKMIPSRLNTSFIYKVKNSRNKFSLDIADGARSVIFPKKITHWGHGYLAEGFDTAVMIVNDNYEKFYQKKFKGTLSVYSENNFKKKIKLEIKPGTLLTLNLQKIRDLKKLSKKKLNFLSWHLKLSEPGCECFWVSYRKKDGSIFGDHSF
tara:strand:- start:3113 stop:4624 length:1512 start_codon:yes stop_codon:yes gene_type:complete